MCTNIELDLADDTIKNLSEILGNQLKNSLDECSYEIFKEASIVTPDDLIQAVGAAVVNGCLVDSIKMAIEEHNAEISDVD